ncbi:MAG TPA: TOBE domain-containing protein [Geobacteraceae bacterium]|nr:TOBE domain-containing protein [Geobacteraceae bacterium]
MDKHPAPILSSVAIENQFQSMNKLSGKISQLTISGNMTLVDVDVRGTQMTVITIGVPEKVAYLKTGKDIELLFNESEVSIGKLGQGEISLINQMDCVVERLVPGQIFSQVMLSFQGFGLTSLITTRSARRLNLEPGDRVTAFIKTNEVLLKEPNGIGHAH